jgi:hypothetical protein
MATPHQSCPSEEFTVRLRERIPMNVYFSFNRQQLDGLRRVFGDRFDAEHAVDMRGRLYLPWSRYYFVLQAGRDRRRDLRRGGGPGPRRTVSDSVLCGMAVTGLAAAAIWLATSVPWQALPW